MQLEGEYYKEHVAIPPEKPGLTIRGRKGCWPILSSAGLTTHFPVLLTVLAPHTTIEGLVLVHLPAQNGRLYDTINVKQGPFRMRSAVLYARKVSSGNLMNALQLSPDQETVLEDCALVACEVANAGDLVVRDSVWLAGGFGNIATKARVTLHNVVVRDVFVENQCEMRSCTVPGTATLQGAPNIVIDSIVGAVSSREPDTRVDYCDIFPAGFGFLAKPGESCFSGDPQFVDPKNCDYRLRPTSPCIGKASDGGDIGCRYTPEMVEIIQKALELRAKGIIKF